MQSRKRDHSKDIGRASHRDDKDEDNKKHTKSVKYIIGLLLLIVLCLGAFGTYQKSHDPEIDSTGMEVKLTSVSPLERSSVHDFSVMNHPNEKLRGTQSPEKIVEKIVIPRTTPPHTTPPVLEDVMLGRIEQLRGMKGNGVIMESDPEAQRVIAETQSLIRQYLTQKYGPGPYKVMMRIKFPDSMPSPPQSPDPGNEASIVIEMAPIEEVPYSVYMFLEHVLSAFKGGSFHRNAGHVLQAMINTGSRKKFAWQEYSPKYPHQQYTLGYAGRPSGSTAIYISTLDNTRNHGPASQGSKSEADSCFGRVLEGVDVVKRMMKQPGAGSSGFITSEDNYIKILSLTMLSE